jgi:hypothetical protein
MFQGREVPYHSAGHEEARFDPGGQPPEKPAGGDATGECAENVDKDREGNRDYKGEKAGGIGYAGYGISRNEIKRLVFFGGEIIILAALLYFVGPWMSIGLI